MFHDAHQHPHNPKLVPRLETQTWDRFRPPPVKSSGLVDALGPCQRQPFVGRGRPAPHLSHHFSYSRRASQHPPRRPRIHPLLQTHASMFAFFTLLSYFLFARICPIVSTLSRPLPLCCFFDATWHLTADPPASPSPPLENQTILEKEKKFVSTPRGYSSK